MTCIVQHLLSRSVLPQPSQHHSRPLTRKEVHYHVKHHCESHTRKDRNVSAHFCVHAIFSAASSFDALRAQTPSHRPSGAVRASCYHKRHSETMPPPPPAHRGQGCPKLTSSCLDFKQPIYLSIRANLPTVVPASNAGSWIRFRVGQQLHGCQQHPSAYPQVWSTAQ